MRKLLLLLSPLLMLLTGCEKDPGEGGRAEITGRVLAQNRHSSTQIAVGDPYPFPEHRVYIIYGDGEFHDDDVRTSADGRFRFSGLRKGHYRIYTISQKPRTSQDQNGTVAVFAEVDVVERRDVIDVGDILIDRYRGWQ